MNADEFQKIYDSLNEEQKQTVDLLAHSSLNTKQIATALGYRDTGKLFNTIAPVLYQKFDIPLDAEKKFDKLAEKIREAKGNIPDRGGETIPKPSVSQGRRLLLITVAVFFLLLGWVGGSIYPIPIVRSSSPMPTSRVTLESQNTEALEYVTSTSPVSPTKLAINTPVNTVLPSPTTSSIIFSDNFESGIKSEWNIINGNPGIIDGELTSQADTTWISLALPSELKNFIFEFDLVNQDGICSAPKLIIAPIFQDLNNYIGLYFSNCLKEWSVLTNGQDKRSYFKDPGSGFHFKITVNNDYLTLYMDGKEAGSIFNNVVSQGKIGLYLIRGDRLDNILISALP
jgi:hypothetical protein